MPSAPKLSIIVPTWNNLPMLRLCVSSLRRHTKLPCQLIVHVNDGSDGTLDWIQKEAIEHTWTAQNVGICRALNSAFARCRSDYVVYLNDDMYVLPGWDRPLIERAAMFGAHEPCYVAGTMIQAQPISPVAVKADYGLAARDFRERALLEDFNRGKLACDDWNGATWPPCCIHRKWWDVAGGYDEALSPGFYSDIDFSMRLWQTGCRRFYGVGSSLVYHFGEVTTSLVRGRRDCHVKRARLQFLKKWGVLPSTFRKHFLRVTEPPLDCLPDSDLGEATWERARVYLLGALNGLPRRRVAA
jgi:GT2 family glycosyltransferase